MFYDDGMRPPTLADFFPPYFVALASALGKVITEMKI